MSIERERERERERVTERSKSTANSNGDRIMRILRHADYRPDAVANERIWGTAASEMWRQVLVARTGLVGVTGLAALTGRVCRATVAWRRACRDGKTVQRGMNDSWVYWYRLYYA